MKYIILGAGKSNILDTPHSLIKYNQNEEVLAHQLKTMQKDNSDVFFVGGYKILDIMEKYPNLKYFYNKNWTSTKTLYSLSLVGNIENDIIITYGDTVFKKDIIEKFIDTNDDIILAIDSSWKDRYIGRDFNHAEVVYYEENKHKFSRYNGQDNIIGEFVGLIKLSKNISQKLKEYITLSLKDKSQDGVIDLINILIEKNISYKLIDIKGEWSELDSIQDLEHFKFGTKAETLQNLKSKLKKSNILEQIAFTVGEYENDNHKILDKIKNKLNSELLVVRSSALNEDTENSSMAGSYESILKVPKDDVDILNQAIKKVIESYKKNNHKQDINNQILVQPYLKDVVMSGVVFSKNLQTFSPYYIINYDISSDTESVTSGNGIDLNTFICYNDYTENIKDKKIKVLIDAIKEIEHITKYDAIDVEFAFAMDKLYILQVRAIAAKKDSIQVSKNNISNEIVNMKLLLKRDSINLLGNKKAYGIMPDWNPAEIIGINPKPLSFDLYKYLITDNIWGKSRKLLGYRDVDNNVGIISFAGKPYVDIQMSFNTFIPNNLPDNIGNKLVNYFIDKLKQNPDSHDKVEFLVAITSYDFTFKEKIIEFLENGFSKDECSLIEKSYKKLTENIILEKSIFLENEIAKTLSLTEKREKVLNSNLDEIDKIYFLLEDCKKYGTLPFSNLARCGFIGSIFLKSLLQDNTITQKEYDSLFKSIHTVAKEFMDDFNLLLSGKITKEKFLEKYGHLRPGTYDITSKTYKDGYDEYIDFNSSVIKNNSNFEFNFSDNTKKKIKDKISKHNLKFDYEQLISFIIKSTEAREKAKFEFTKNLSAVLDLITKIGEKFNLSKEDLSYLNLNTILEYKNSSSKFNIKKRFQDNILENKQKYLVTSAIHLPELIFNMNDIEMFHYPSLKPNFVSHHKLIADIVVLKDHNKKNINDKIVLIENADPGFDWVFSHNIKGLVTKYGGAASHMAIRCAEFDLPAAIGCGDKIYNELLKYNKISLDCINQKIKGFS